jgi:hypothetical protein
MKNLLILAFSILLMSCNGREKHLKKIAVPTAAPKASVKQAKSGFVKFEPHSSFSDFRVLIEDASAEPGISSHGLGRKYRTTIREEYKNPKSLFAGHYSLIYWGCGSPCQMSVIVDRRDGKIYDSPAASVGYEFQKDSRMLLVNPPDSLGNYIEDCPYCIPEIYVLNERTKKFEQKKP